MRNIVSVRGVLVVVILLVAALSAGTALAARQSAVSPQASLTDQSGASVVTDTVCLSPVSKAEPATLTVWGSGWASNELVLVSLVKNAADIGIWYSGSVNAAGAFELSFDVIPALPRPSRSDSRPLAPDPGPYTLEVMGTSGRLATAPLVFVEDKCPNS